KPCCSRQRATVRRTRFDTREDLAGSVVARATVVSVRPNIEARWMTLGPFEAGSLLEVTMDPDRHREGPQPMASRPRSSACKAARGCGRPRGFASPMRLGWSGVARLRGRCHYHGNFVIGIPAYRNHGSAR